MGLHLCYELDLPLECSDAHVAESLTQLHRTARDLPFDQVTPVFQVAGAECEPGTWGEGDPLEWFFKHFTTGYREIDEYESTSVRALAAVGFTVAPGRRCEPATFGLARYAEPVTAHPDRDGPGVATLGWHWHTCCKTQYASVVSDEHLIRCHLSLVSLLEAAAEVGIRVTVRDETHYWETRDTKRLIDEVHRMNRIVAKLAGRLGDAVGEGFKVGGSITDHPRFEHLEME